MRQKTKKITSTVLVQDIKNYEQSFENLADYPLYASTCGLLKSEGVALERLYLMLQHLKVENDTRVKITVEIVEKQTV